MRPRVTALFGIIAMAACTAGEDIQSTGAARDAASHAGTGGTAHPGSGGAAGASRDSSMPNDAAGGARADASVPSDAAGGAGTGGAGTGGAGTGGAGTGGAGTGGAGTGGAGTGGALADASEDAPAGEAGSCSSAPACVQSNWTAMFKDYRCSIGTLIWTCTTDCRNCGSDTRCCPPQQTGCPWAGETWASSPCN